MDLLLKEQMSAMPELRKSLRQLRWFQATFRKHANLLAKLYGSQFELDEKRLAVAFFNWVEVVDQNKHFAKVHRKDFITFSAGVVLRELIKLGPATVTRGARTIGNDMTAQQEIFDFWPEGFLYTNYCICAIAAIQEQECGISPSLDQCADELRTWWSFKENVRETPSYAIAFLDKFLGGEPNWGMPETIAKRALMVKSGLGDNQRVGRI